MVMKKEKPYALTTALAMEIVARKKIRPDAPGTRPGEPGNGHVLVIDSDHQMFGGNIYTSRFVRQDKILRYKYNADGRTHLLHIEVWKFHNGEIPGGFVIHHDHRRLDGTFDPNENNIEHLFMMKKSEHSYYHNVATESFERTCQNPKCGKKFHTINHRAMYCCEQCGRDTRTANRIIGSNFVTPEIAKQLEEAIAIASDVHFNADSNNSKQAMEIRSCFFCHRPFITRANRPGLVCARPGCKGRALLIALAEMQNSIAKRAADRSNKLRTFYNEQFGKLDTYVDENGVPWFIGRQVAEMLGYKNTKDALIRLVEKDDRKIVSLDEIQRSGIPTFASPRGLTFINEFGMNDLIIQSQLPAAKEIRHWLTHEVMPKLRRRGYYSFLDNPSFMSDYFSDEELMMLFLFREQCGSVQALADLNRLTDAERQLVVQMIKMLVNRHEEPSIIAEAAKNA